MELTEQQQAILGNFTNCKHKSAKPFKRAWKKLDEAGQRAFLELAQKVHKKGLDWYPIGQATYPFRFGRKEKNLGIHAENGVFNIKISQQSGEKWVCFKNRGEKWEMDIIPTNIQAILDKLDEKPFLVVEREGHWPDAYSDGGDESSPLPDIYKMSHGKAHFNKQELEYFGDNCLVVIGEKTAKGQVSAFKKAKEGDLFFLCYTNTLQLLGEFTSDATQCSDRPGWLQRSYKILADSKDKETSYSAINKGWTPNHNSTFYQVRRTEFEMFEKNLLKPYFKIDLKELARLANSSNPSSTTPTSQNSAIPQDYQYQGNHIFYGPPGTGKTYKMQALKEHYKEGERYDFVTFHQSYGYEDFIEGLRPQLEDTGGQVQYEIRTGVFKALCKRAKNDPDNRYAMFIDEINRGNISKILGELITLIELDKREGKKNELSVTLPYSGDIFSVPANVDIIGTMNTADRSLALLDTALRRRFEFTELAPDYELLNNKVIEGIHLRRMLETMNQRIEALYDREHCLGHAYFLHCPDFAALQNTFKTKILPLLQEYFFDDWEKIRLVLGDNQKQNQNLAFVNLESPTDEPTELEQLFGNIADDHQPVLKKRYKINEDAFKNPEAYKGIYQRA